MTTRMLFVMALIAWTLALSRGFADEPTFDERLERLTEENERSRVNLHSPGCALVGVRRSSPQVLARIGTHVHVYMGGVHASLGTTRDDDFHIAHPQLPRYAFGYFGIH